MPNHPPSIGAAERLQRLAALRRNMEAAGAKAVVLELDDKPSLLHRRWHASERFCGAIVHADRLEYVAPRFELENYQASSVRRVTC